MNGQWIPAELGALHPWHEDLFHNMVTVQFNHRMIAWLLALVVPWFWWRCVRSLRMGADRIAVHVLLAAFFLQASLGIATLLNAVPVALGAAHQAGAVALMTAALVVNHRLLRSSAPLSTAAGLRDKNATRFA
jgi:cytochrome c oxidase assembly protein subunit 15